jgi:predicted MPP superfamily phosphohydrolase
MILSAYYYLVIKLRQVELPIFATLNKGKSLRILHLSDLHLTPKQKTKISDLKELSSLDPDLTIVTGDFLAHQDSVPAVIDALGGLLTKPGFFVFGSNDYFAPTIKNPISYLFSNSSGNRLGRNLPWLKLQNELVKTGWLNLNQRKLTTSINGITIEARGTDDAHLNRDDYVAVSGKRNPDAHLSIGVTHAPYVRLLDAMHEDNLDLIIAGHTHGGQVRLPLPNFLGGSRALTTNCDLPTWRARGLSKVADQPWLHISAGIGRSPFTPFRLASPPEATLLTLSEILN